jgi:hypothetical protein
LEIKTISSYDLFSVAKHGQPASYSNLILAFVFYRTKNIQILYSHLGIVLF